MEMIDHHNIIIKMRPHSFAHLSINPKLNCLGSSQVGHVSVHNFHHCYCSEVQSQSKPNQLPSHMYHQGAIYVSDGIISTVKCSIPPWTEITKKKSPRPVIHPIYSYIFVIIVPYIQKATQIGEVYFSDKYSALNLVEYPKKWRNFNLRHSLL